MEAKELQYGAPTDKCAITVLLGIEKGYFRDEGIDLSVRVIFGGPALAAAYDAGELEFGEIGSPPAIDAISRGARFRIVGGAVRRKVHMYLGVRSDIRDFQALKGKRVGVLSIGSCSEWVGRAMLLREGVNPDRDITFVPLGDDYPRVVSLVSDGHIDAFLETEPNLSIGEHQGVLRVWAAAYDEPYLPQFQWEVLVARLDLIEREPELIRRVLRAYRRAAHYAAEHLDEWEEFAGRHYGIDRETARRAIERDLPHLHLDCEIDLAGLQRAIELQQRLGAIDRPMAVEEIADLRFLPVERERRG